MPVFLRMGDLKVEYAGKEVVFPELAATFLLVKRPFGSFSFSEKLSGCLIWAAETEAAALKYGIKRLELNLRRKGKGFLAKKIARREPVASLSDSAPASQIPKDSDEAVPVAPPVPMIKFGA